MKFLSFKAHQFSFSSIMLFISIVAAVISCTPYDDPGDQENDTIPVETIFWEPDDAGFIQLYTNDTRYLGIDGWTFWKWDDLTVEDPMNYVETQVKKISGEAGMGYGVIFCFTDSDNFFIRNVLY